MSEDLPRGYLEGSCIENLLRAQDEEEGWFIAAPGYAPYGEYVWFRDNAECVMSIDDYSEVFGQRWMLERTRRTLVRSFSYLAEKEGGVRRLRGIRDKFRDPEFGRQDYHPHARLARGGTEVPGPWHNIQYDSVARLLVALARHLALIPDREMMERCKAGARVALEYLFDAIWTEVDGERWLTVCANEWEEKEEPHLRDPLFSSVVGVISAASRVARGSLEEWLPSRDLDVEGVRRTCERLLRGFVVDGALRMIKRFNEPAIGSCSSSLWLLTTYGVFPVGGEVFLKTLRSLERSEELFAESSVRVGGRELGLKGLRRFAIAREGGLEGEGYVDTYWGGQAWVITTAQLATAHAMVGEAERAEELLVSCLRVTDPEGRLPEQLEGTYYDATAHESWKKREGQPAPPPWLAWSHAEVLKAYSAIRKSA